MLNAGGALLSHTTRLIPLPSSTAESLESSMEGLTMAQAEAEVELMGGGDLVAWASERPESVTARLNSADSAAGTQMPFAYDPSTGVLKVAVAAAAKVTVAWSPGPVAPSL